jgi:hypothetical protein
VGKFSNPTAFVAPSFSYPSYGLGLTIAPHDLEKMDFVINSTDGFGQGSQTNLSAGNIVKIGVQQNTADVEALVDKT